MSVHFSKSDVISSVLKHCRAAVKRLHFYEAKALWRKRTFKHLTF